MPLPGAHCTVLPIPALDSIGRFSFGLKVVNVLMLQEPHQRNGEWFPIGLRRHPCRVVLRNAFLAWGEHLRHEDWPFFRTAHLVHRSPEVVVKDQFFHGGSPFGIQLRDDRCLRFCATSTVLLGSRMRHAPGARLLVVSVLALTL